MLVHQIARLVIGEHGARDLERSVAVPFEVVNSHILQLPVPRPVQPPTVRERGFTVPEPLLEFLEGEVAVDVDRPLGVIWCGLGGVCAHVMNPGLWKV